MQPTKPRAILFDLDGTLADTAPDLAAAVNRLRSERNLPLADYEALRQVASAGARPDRCCIRHEAGRRRL